MSGLCQSFQPRSDVDVRPCGGTLQRIWIIAVLVSL
jgi:hypothetical protein